MEYHPTMRITSTLFIINFNREELFENIKNASLDMPPHVSPLAKDLIIKLMNRNPKKRLGAVTGADEIRKHPFFKCIDWQKLTNR